MTRKPLWPVIALNLIAWAVLLTGACAAWGQCVGGQCQQRDPAVVRLSDGGSGVVVSHDGTPYVLSCAHKTATTSVRLGEQMTGSFSDGVNRQLRVVAVDTQRDCAVYSVSGVPLSLAAQLAESPALQGDPVTVQGFPLGRWRERRATVYGYLRGEDLLLWGLATPGESGGPIRNAAGEVVGILLGYNADRGFTICCPLKVIRGLLGRIRERRRERIRETETPVPMPEVAEPEREPTEAGLLAWQQEMERQIESLEEGADTQSTSVAAKLRALRAACLLVEQQVEGLHGYVDKADNKLQDRTDEQMGGIRDQVAALAKGRVGLFQGLSMGKLLAGALGVSGPLGLAVVVAGGLMGRAAKRRLAGDDSDTSAAVADDPEPPETTTVCQPVAVDSPPTPQQVIPETHYVTVEGNEFAEAYQWASEQVARKWPGATTNLTALDSLIRQQLNATK